MPLVTTPFEPEKYFTDPAAQARLIEDAVSTGHAGYIADALGIIARARGIKSVAEQAGVTRMALYKSLTAEGDPKLSTVLGVMKALGVKMKVEAA